MSPRPELFLCTDELLLSRLLPRISDSSGWWRPGRVPAAPAAPAGSAAGLEPRGVRRAVSRGLPSASRAPSRRHTGIFHLLLCTGISRGWEGRSSCRAGVSPLA